MDGPKLNEECCFSCLEPFEAARSEISLSENSDALKRILEVNFLYDRSNESMNLCIPCYTTFKEAKEEYLQLKEVEKRFNAKRTQFAFRVVKSVEDDDYLGTSIVDNFLNARAKIYTKWHKAYKDAANEDNPDDKEVGEGEVGGGESGISKVSVKPVKFSPVPVAASQTSPIIVKKVVTMQNGQSGRKEPAPVPVQSAVNTAEKRKIIYVKRDILTGKVFQFKSSDSMKPVTTYRINQTAAPGQSSPRILAQPTKSIFQINKDGTVVKHPNSVQPQARPIVRTPIIPTPTRFVPIPKSKAIQNPPIVLAKKSLPTVTTATMSIKRAATEISVQEVEAGEEEQQTTPEKKKRRESQTSIQSQSPTQLTQLSNRSRRIIRKPIDSSCLYGNEYERAVKNSSKKNQLIKARAVKRTDSTVEMMNEDSYRYDMEEHEEGEGGTFDQFDDDGNIDQLQAEASDVEN